MVLQVWNHVLTKQCNHFREVKQVFHANNRAFNNVAVIVEPRKHPMLEPVVRNIMHHLGNGWNLEIISYQNNIQYIEQCFPGCVFRVATLPFPNMNQTLYNHLLMDPWFWWHLPEENILIFQTDCIMFRKGIDMWLDFDYIGANYFNELHTSPHYGGIQGGLSLRKRTAMLQCIEKVSWKTIQYYRTHHGLDPLTCFHEDVYFTHACEILGKKTIDINHRKRFAIEAEFYENALGHHGTTKTYFTNEQIATLISQSNEEKIWDI